MVLADEQVEPEFALIENDLGKLGLQHAAAVVVGLQTGHRRMVSKLGAQAYGERG